VTRLITLDRITRQDAARDFLGLENVPRFALTMGVGTILRARRIVLMAWGTLCQAWKIRFWPFDLLWARVSKQN